MIERWGDELETSDVAERIDLPPVRAAAAAAGNQKTALRGWQQTALPRWAQRLLWWSLHAATLGVAGLAIAGYLGRLGWLFELASHFRLQYGVLLAASTLAYLIARCPRVALATGMLSAANLCLVASVGTPPPRPHDRQVVRAVVCNVRAINRQHERVVEFVRASKADLVLLVEVNFDWSDAINALDAEYPYGDHSPAFRNWGIALLSRLPLEDVRMDMIGGRSPSLAVVARLAVEGRPLTVIGAHPFSPISPSHFAKRNRQLASVASLARKQSGAVMLFGDLNTSPWSPYFQDLLSASGLRDSRQGFGIQATWPVAFPPARIPIDHCLVSPEIAVHERHIGPDVGSDHLPVIVDFSLQP